MGIVSKQYVFVNGAVADATQVNADMDTLYNLVNGNLDATNIAPNTIGTGLIVKEAVTPDKTEGVVYAFDLFGGSFVLNGVVASKDGTTPTKLDLSAGVAYITQNNGTLRRFSILSNSFTVSSASATYFLDLNPDGTWSFTTGHSSQSGYLNIATVTTDGSGNILNVTPNNLAYAVTLLQGASTQTTVQGLATPALSFFIRN